MLAGMVVACPVPVLFASSMSVAFLPLDEYWRVALQGAMVCLICPTATAAAVITGKLGGSAAALTTYTLLSNLLAAIMVPLVFPLVEPTDIAFGESFLRILGKVFPLLLFPFLQLFFCAVSFLLFTVFL